MVLKMANQGMRAPSPPLPPDPADPSPRTISPIQTSQHPRASVSQPATPVTPSKESPQPGLTRVDSSRTQQQRQRQPIKDAVSDAFEHSPVTNQLNNLSQLDPEFIKQVTEQVIRNLQAANTTPTAPVQPQQTQYAPPPPPPPQQRSQEPRSPTQSSIDSGGARYTPPTPERNREARESGVTSPSPSPSDASNVSHESRESFRSDESQRNSTTPRPLNSESTGQVPRSNYSARRRSGTQSQEEGGIREAGGYDGTARDRTPIRRNSKDPDYDAAARPQARESPVQPDTGETPLEKFWQPLFDNGNPTMRLSQFLRGLALHLIDDYDPKGSIVVTPDKMLQFLNETRVGEEHYPWQVIFGGKMTPVSISLMFQKMLCQHHLVQDRFNRVPTIPGLTPQGFDWFMTCLIQAHPDTEFERLAKAVMNMPISNADNKAERFPKELSRRLLPSKGSIQAEQRLISSLDHEPQVFATLKGYSQMPPPPPNPPPTQSFNDHSNNQYSQSSQRSDAFDDEDLAGPPAMPIERERKPYTAKEGTGKQYADGRPNPAPYRGDAAQGSGTRSSRTNSGVPHQTMYTGGSGPSEPVNIPTRHPHRLSTSQVPPPMANGGHSRSNRRSPPPTRNPFAKSEPEFVGSMPNSQFGSNLHPTQSREQYTPVDMDEEQSKRYRSRSRADRPGTLGSNSTDEDRGYPIPGRASVPVTNGYEYGTGPTIPGAPVGSDPRAQPSGSMHPVGSYPARRPGMGTSVGDGRRRSMHASAFDGGTDGYGSFSPAMNGGSGYPPPQQQPHGTSAQH